jgi:glycine cleavage system aminomethyltransferase T
MIGPLESVLYRDGATMIERHGRRVAAHFGSRAGEEAVSLKAVGLADRSDRTTLDVRGDVDAALLELAPIGERAWSSYAGPERAVVRCELTDATTVRDALSSAPGVTIRDVTREYAAIALVGPNAEAVLDAADLPSSAITLHEAGLLYEILVPAPSGPAIWDQLLEVGAPFQIACVGLEALEHLTATRRLHDARRPAADGTPTLPNLR